MLRPLSKPDAPLRFARVGAYQKEEGRRKKAEKQWFEQLRTF
ncbi:MULTISPECIES: hypothetical protein [unclassified Microcoleus]|nr:MULTISPECIES: hypothetical protein [unclassified Microcoleus]